MYKEKHMQVYHVKTPGKKRKLDILKSGQRGKKRHITLKSATSLTANTTEREAKAMNNQAIILYSNLTMIGK